jgi:GntR family transcriptional regulator, transcriptional repressor for pyruvate dehydrogenase complex
MTRSATLTPRDPPARSPKLAQKLIQIFAEKIQKGAITAGTKLPNEFEIMREHGVSRAVVREAISRLQAAGLVEAKHGVGTFVLETAKGTNFRIDPATVVTMEDVLALLELRISFESESAYLAAIRHTPAHLQEMQASIDAIQRQLETGDETKRADFDFHLRVASATGNRYYIDLLNNLGLAILPRTRLDLRTIAGENAHQYLTRSNEEHRDVLKAIARKDPDGARAAMRTHLNNSREHLRRLYEQSQAATPKA